MRLAVAGGTGTLGHHVVEAATAAGHEAVVLSRSAGVDLHDESRVAAALEGAEVVVDAANSGTNDERRSTAFFTEVTERLSRLGAAAGARRLVLVSIVGIDRVPFGYYRAKLAQEETARRGPLPVSIVRATQFHEFPAQMLERTSLGPVAAALVMRSQPVAARALAERLVAVAADPSPPATSEVAGPQAESMVRLARATLARQRRRKLVVPLPLPGAVGHQMRAGGLLPGPGALLLGPDFATWLAAQPTT